MELNLNTLYVVYKPTKHSEKVDVYDGRNTLAELFSQVRGGLRADQVHAIFTTANEADKEANRLLNKSGSSRKEKLIKRGEGFAIFKSEVPARYKYEVQTKPKVYATRKEAEQALATALKQGWKKSDLKILTY